MIIMMFGYMFHSVIGWVINISGDFSYGIAVIPCALTIGIIGFTVIYLSERRVSMLSIRGEV